MLSFFAEVKIFRFWPKTMDYNQAFLPKLRSFFLLLTGRCYEAEICVILMKGLLYLMRTGRRLPLWPSATTEQSESALQDMHTHCHSLS